MKKLFKLRYWFSVLLPCLLIMLNGCKKENANEKLTDTQQIENAKNWFSEQQKNQVTTFMNSKGKEINLTFVPDWENAAVAQVGSATVITATVKTNLQSIYGESTQFNLVIKNEDNSYDSKTLKIRPNDEGGKENILDAAELYKTAFTNEDLSSEQLNAEIKIYNAHFKSNKTILYTATGRTMIAEEKPASNWKPYTEQKVDDHKTFTAKDLQKTMELQCYDAYMVTRVYEDGVLVDIYQEYLGFQICSENQTLNPEDLGAGGSPGGGETNVNISFETDDTFISTGNIVETTDSEGIRRRQRTEAWRFGTGTYLGYTFFGYSTELLQTKYVNGIWEWESVTNQSYYTGGQRPDGTEFVKDGYAINNYTSTKAYLQFTSHINYLNHGQRSTTPKNSYNNFDKP